MKIVIQKDLFLFLPWNNRIFFFWILCWEELSAVHEDGKCSLSKEIKAWTLNQWGCSCTVDVKISCTQLHYKHKVSLYLSLITHMQIWKSTLQEFPRGVFSAWYDFNSSLVSLGIWIICESLQNCLRPSSPVIDQWTGIMYFFMQLFFF